MQTSYCSSSDLIYQDALQDYFMRLVDGMVDASLGGVRHYVRTYLAERISAARTQLHDYGERYTDAMLSALETSRAGAYIVQADPPSGWYPCSVPLSHV